MATGRVIVYGGRGALGTAIVDHFAAKNFWTLNVDLTENDRSNANVLVPNDASWTEQEKVVLDSVQKAVGEEKVDAIFCVAGGWAGGSAKSAAMIKNADLTWKQSVWSSSICARMATIHLRPGGLVQFTGAAGILGGSPGMIGYGMAKAAIHHLTKSLAAKDSGLPEEASSLAILPVCLDTPANRKFMPKADVSKWTSLEFIADLLHQWTTNAPLRPENGSLVKLVTEEGQTRIELV